MSEAQGRFRAHVIRIKADTPGAHDLHTTLPEVAAAR